MRKYLASGRTLSHKPRADNYAPEALAHEVQGQAGCGERQKEPTVIAAFVLDERHLGQLRRSQVGRGNEDRYPMRCSIMHDMRFLHIYPPPRE